MQKIKMIYMIFTTLFSVLCFQTIADCQNVIIKNDDKINSDDRKETVESISKILTDSYVFPDVASEMIKFIGDKLKNNEYESITGGRNFSDQLTKDLQSISKDKHLRVNYSPRDAADLKNRAVGEKQGPDRSKEIARMKSDNYGFKKVEVLKGNIGYIDFRFFAPEEYSKETIAAAMNFVSNCSALIIDLRQNGGGDPTGVRQICSYFFNDTPVHLNDLYFRPGNKTEEFWTLKDLPGKRMPDIDLYVLTSSYTFSGAEEFSYNLKNLKRATIVGETTGGGAHPGETKAVNESFVIFVPNGRAINPITKTDWEGTGVTPDVSVSRDKALATAQLMSLEKAALRTNDVELKNQILWQSESIRAELNPVAMDGTILNSFAGNYGERKVTFENGELYYQRADRPKMKMIPMSESQFQFSDVDYFRVKFVKDTNGNVTGLQGLYDNGQVDVSDKN